MKRELLGGFGPVSTYLETDDDGANERLVLVKTGGYAGERAFANAAEARDWLERGHKTSLVLPNTPDELRGLLGHVRMWIRDCAARTFGNGAHPHLPAGKVMGTPMCGQDSPGVKAAVALLPGFQRAALERRTGIEAAWLLWDSTISKWWKPAAFGYTSNVMHAGVFTLEAAEHRQREGVDSVFHITWALAPGSAEEGSVHALLTSGGMAALNEATVPADDLGEVGR